MKHFAKELSKTIDQYVEKEKIVNVLWDTLNEKEELNFNGILIAKFNGEQGFLNVSEIKGYMIDDSSVEWFLKNYHLNNDEEHVIEYHVMTDESDQYTISFNINQSNEVSIVIT